MTTSRALRGARRPNRAINILAGGAGSLRQAIPHAISPPRPAATTPRPDAALVLRMYDDINDTFQRNPDDGVRALIASQYPGDRADVDFARCVNAMSPGAKTLPMTKRFHFVPNILTMTVDPGYTLTSDRVKGLHPQGRIYVTEVTITDGSKPTVHQRHQVILDGRAYQFSTC